MHLLIPSLHLWCYLGSQSQTQLNLPALISHLSLRSALPSALFRPFVGTGQVPPNLTLLTPMPLPLVQNCLWVEQAGWEDFLGDIPGYTRIYLGEACFPDLPSQYFIKNWTSCGGNLSRMLNFKPVTVKIHRAAHRHKCFCGIMASGGSLAGVPDGD